MNDPYIITPRSNLTAWHKKQVAMLYYFSSVDYLKSLHHMVGDLIDGVVDPLLDMAKAQHRDRLLISKAWGDRNTSQNWANHAWPFLKDLQTSLAKSIAFRTSNRYHISAVNECLRGISEFSLDWTTPEEEHVLKLALSTISDYASRFDRTVEAPHNRWNDYRFAYNYSAFAACHSKIPEFRLRNDVVGETGKAPPQTGVYFCPDDLNSSVQFAWNQNGGVELRPANTFNDIGLAALSAVGRDALWFDEGKMFNFATSKPYDAHFHDSVHLDGEPYPSLAPAAVARSAFTTRPCKWLLVEVVPGQFEDLDSLVELEPTMAPFSRRIAGGERCSEAGFYFTPSRANSRRFFAEDEIMPQFNSSYGTTYWQWDSNQTA
jgi:hypothetical protein